MQVIIYCISYILIIFASRKSQDNFLKVIGLVSELLLISLDLLACGQFEFIKMKPPVCKRFMRQI